MPVVMLFRRRLAITTVYNKHPRPRSMSLQSSGFTVQDVSFLTHTRLALFFTDMRQKVSENIVGKGEIACFLSLCIDNSYNLAKCKVVCKWFQIGPKPNFSIWWLLILYPAK